MAVAWMSGHDFIASADAQAFFPYPYGNTTIQNSAPAAPVGNWVNVDYIIAGPLPGFPASVWGHFRFYASANTGMILCGVSDRYHASTYGRRQVSFYISTGNFICAETGGEENWWAPYRGAGAAALGTGTTPISLGVWYDFQFEVTVDNSVGIVKTWINGVQDINESGKDTQYTAHTYVTDWQLGYNYRYDDVVFGDATSPNASPPGDVRVDAHFPVTPNGSDSEWTRSTGSDNWTLVDDTAASTGTADYIESTAVGDQTSFNVEALKVAGGVITAVCVTAYLTKANAGSGSVKPYVLRGGTRYYGDEWYPSFGSWQFFRYVWNQDPAAGPGTWTETNFNASEFGLERTA